jgi:hypothetical protein
VLVNYNSKVDKPRSRESNELDSERVAILPPARGHSSAYLLPPPCPPCDAIFLLAQRWPRQLKLPPVTAVTRQRAGSSKVDTLSRPGFIFADGRASAYSHRGGPLGQDGPGSFFQGAQLRVPPEVLMDSAINVQGHQPEQTGARYGDRPIGGIYRGRGKCPTCIGAILLPWLVTSAAAR